jgi:metacaspase-1
MDLPYIYSTQGKIKEPNLLAEVGSGAMGLIGSYARKDYGGMLKTVTGLGKKVMNGIKLSLSLSIQKSDESCRFGRK